MRCRMDFTRKEKHKFASKDKECEYILPCGLCLLTNQECKLKSIKGEEDVKN